MSRNAAPARLPVLGALALLAAAALAPAGSRDVALAGPPPALTNAKAKSPDISKAELQDLVKTLASDAFEGREAGSAGCDLAADLVAAEFQRLGLQPLGDQGTYFQKFTLPRGMKVLPTSALDATGADAGDKAVAFKVGEEFVPIDVSAAGDVTAEAVFAGYGIVAPDLGYDDYVGLDVKGKVVVVLRRAPAYQDKKSPFGIPATMQKYAPFAAKAEAAAAAGAAALVVVNDPASSAAKDKDDLANPGGGATGKIPVVHMTWRAGKRLGSALGISLAKLQQQIDGKVVPRSEALPGTKVHVKCDLQPDVRNCKNILGLLAPPTAETTGGPPGTAAPAPPTGPAAETVIVGAHYDHVGYGHFGSLSGQPPGKIHNGADDNASGTSAMLEVAGWFAERRTSLKRRVLFAAFSAEELGLLGSKHYVGAPVIPLSDTVAMVNLDMVGRLNDNRLFVGGTGTSPAWPEMVERLNAEMRFLVKMWPGGKAPSDHQSFYEKDVPVIFFFTGLHGDYHRPADDWNTLNYDGQERVARMAAALAFEAANRPERLAFTKCDAGGFEVGPYLGLGVEQRADGPYVAHVDKKSPASKAGFDEGDKLLEWAGQPITDANVFNDFMSKAKSGDKVEFTVQRKGKPRKITATLGST